MPRYYFPTTPNSDRPKFTSVHSRDRPPALPVNITPRRRRYHFRPFFVSRRSDISVLQVPSIRGSPGSIFDYSAVPARPLTVFSTVVLYPFPVIGFLLPVSARSAPAAVILWAPRKSSRSSWPVYLLRSLFGTIINIFVRRR